MKETAIIGDKDTFAFEIGAFATDGPVHPPEEPRSLRIVDIWAGGTRLCVDDNTAYLPQFINDLRSELESDYAIEDFGEHLRELSPPEMAEFVSSTRDETSPNYDLCEDQIWPTYRFLNLGPTTDNITAFLFQRYNTAHLVFSFWRDAKKLGHKETYHSVELKFDQVISNCEQAINMLETDSSNQF